MKRSISVTCVISFLAISCGEGAELSIDEEEYIERTESRARRMNVRVVTPGSEEPSELTVNEFLGAHLENLALGCDEEIAASLGVDVSSVTSSQFACTNDVRKELLHFDCQVERLVELVESELPVEIHDANGGLAVTVLPQTPEARGELAKFTLDAAAALVARAGDTLRAVASGMTSMTPFRLSECGSASDLASMAFGSTTSVGALVTAILTSNVARAEAMGERYGALQHAVAEAELSLSSSLNVATRLGWLDPTMSRAAAVRLLTGGEGGTGIYGYSSDGAGPCATEEPTEDTRGAIHILRASGLPPAIVTDLDVPLRSLLVGGSELGSTLPLQVRAGVLTGDNRFFTTMNEQDMASTLGTSLGALETARRYLAQERIAFARDDDQQVAGGIPVSPDLSGSARALQNVHAGLLREPEGVPSAFSVARVRFADPTLTSAVVDDRTAAGLFSNWPNYTSQPGLIPVSSIQMINQAGTQRVSVGGVVDYALSVASDLGSLDTPVGSWNPLPADVRGELSRFLTGSGERRPHRLQICAIGTGRSQLDEVRIEALATNMDTGRLRIVRGVSGLRCATEGQIEGEPCTVFDNDANTTDVDVSDQTTKFVVEPSVYDRWFGTTQAAGVRTSPIRFDATGNGGPDDFVFVVMQKPGVTNPRPGDFVALGGVRLLSPTRQNNPSFYDHCTVHPVMPELFEKVDELVEMDTTYCALSKVSCAGIAEGEAIPLENELTNDGDGVESSWRHYLNLASTAALHADQLGEALIGAGSAIDQQAELAEDAVRSLCGDSVNVGDAFWDLLDEAPAGRCVCPPDASCSACAPGYLCDAGMCRRDIDAYIQERAATDSAYSALAECLSADGLVPYATPGSRPVCAWRLPGDDDLCTQPDGARRFQCPWLASEAASALPGDAVVADPSMYCPLPDGLPMGTTAILITKRLNIFESQQLPNPGGESDEETPFMCDIIRLYRAETNPALKETYAQDIIAGFDLEKVRGIAGRTSWRGFPDDYSAIVVNGSVWRHTGRPEASAPIVTNWPCGEHSDFCLEEPGDPGASSLFCARIDGACGEVNGTQRVVRAAMNHRMARAVMTLKMITGEPMGDIRLPFVPELENLTLEADVEFANEFGKVKWSFDDSTSDAITLRGSNAVSVSVADRVTYEIWEDDGRNGDDRGTYDRDGAAYCARSSERVLWTHVSADAWGGLGVDLSEGNFEFLSPDCDLIGRKQGDRSSAVLPLVFAAVSGDRNDFSSGIATDAWIGMGVRPTRSEMRDLRGTRVDLELDTTPREWVARAIAGRLVPRYAGATADVDCSLRDNNDRQRWRCQGQPQYTNYFYVDEYNRFSPFRTATGPADEELIGQLPAKAELLDALELACEIAADDLNNPDPFAPTNCGDWDALANIDVSNLREGQRLMQCMAEEVRARGELAIFEDLPRDAIEAMTNPRGLEGDRGREAGEVAAAISDLARFPGRIATQLEQAALQMRLARNAVERNELQIELAELRRMSTQMREVSSCIAETFRSAAAAVQQQQNSLGIGTGSLYFGVATAVCANSIGQIVIASQQAGLETELSNLETDTSLTTITGTLSGILDGMEELSSQAKQAELRLRGAIGAAETRRAQVMNQVEDVLVTYGNPSAPANVRRRVYNTARIRYEEAHERAIRTAWMARRALEQRLGVSLRDLNDPMHLVEAPARWADRLCTMRGFDYRAISRDYDLPGGDDYSVEYVGDYVRRLEDVFESYSVDFPFVDGEDVAVVSMREDVVRAPLLECRVPTHNLLAYSGALSVREDPEVRATIEPGERDEVELPVVWSREGCSSISQADEDGHVSTFVGGCVTTTQTGETINEFAPAANESITRVMFGGVGLGPGGEQLRNWQPQARIAQRIDLPAGRYRLSWYGREQAIPMAQSVNPSSVVSPRTVSGAPLTTPVTATYSQALADGWSRYFRFFEVPEGTVVDISITSPTPDSLTGGQPTLPMVFDIAGLMLEDVGAQVPSLASMPDGAAYPPRAYITTVGNGEGYLAACEDVSGTRFRSEWRYGCERVCPAGTGTCTDGRVACFWERPFEVTLDDIERGSRFRRSGFAIGNYNYRWMSLGVNLVGTGIRDCSSSDSPSTCYGAGYVPFSIHHDPSKDGGYPVRNHQGDVFAAQLFPGRVQHARSLAAERYLSNPLSGTDRALIEPYLRTELRGRPLTGRYTMRVWDDGGLDWSRVEDVQLVLGYRYWTRTR